MTRTVHLGCSVLVSRHHGQALRRLTHTFASPASIVASITLDARSSIKNFKNSGRHKIAIVTGRQTSTVSLFVKPTRRLQLSVTRWSTLGRLTELAARRYYRRPTTIGASYSKAVGASTREIRCRSIMCNRRPTPAEAPPNISQAEIVLDKRAGRRAQPVHSRWQVHGRPPPELR